MKLSFVKIAIAILPTFSACVSIPKEPKSVGEPLLIVESPDAPTALRDAYQKAMDRFFALALVKQDAVFAPYKSLLHETGWAKIETDSSVVAIAGGEPVAFIAFLVPGHPALATWAPTFQTSDISGRPMVTIRPDLISDTWKPVFLIHELSHVAVALNQKKVDPTEDELFAYGLEKLALNIITDFRFDAGLDTLLDKLRFKTESAVIQYDAKKLVDVVVALDKTLFEVQPASVSEGEMRVGIYQIALGFRAIEKLNLSKAAEKRRKTLFLRAFLKAKSKIHGSRS